MESQQEKKSPAETFNRYAALVWNWAWLLILCALLAGGIIYWTSNRQTRIYQASALILIDSAPNIQSALDVQTLYASQQLAATYAQEMTTTPVLDEVAKRLKLASFPGTASVIAMPIQDTQLMTVTVQDTDPKRAALLASTVVQVFSDQLQSDHASRYADTKKSLEEQLASLEQLMQTASSDLAALGSGEQDQIKRYQIDTTLAGYRQSYGYVLQGYQSVKLAEAQSSSGIILKQPPEIPGVPVKPTPVKSAILAAMVGLILAAGTIFLIDFLDNSIRDPEEITKKWGVPVLGMIISYDQEKNILITAKQPRSPITESFRSLRTNLDFVGFKSLAHSLLITSASPQEGKTTVAVNLANVIAQSGHKVVVVDTDMRRPRVHKVFQMSNRFGLSDQFIHSEDHLNGFVRQTEYTDLQVLTSGPLPPNPSELLGSEKMISLLNQLTNQFEVTILDAPPLLPVTDALVLARRVDGVIMVVRPTVTKWAALSNAFKQLKQVNANVIGVVLNDVQIKRSRYYHYSRYYGKEYSKGYQYMESDDILFKKPKTVLPGQSDKAIAAGRFRKTLKKKPWFARLPLLVGKKK
jgi:polysaccharide biosynthesis transport protein